MFCLYGVCTLGVGGQGLVVWRHGFISLAGESSLGHCVSCFNMGKFAHILNSTAYIIISAKI
jgi:hypothetical protein